MLWSYSNKNNNRPTENKNCRFITNLSVQWTMAHYTAFNCANFDKLELQKKKKLAPSDHKTSQKFSSLKHCWTKCAIDV